MCVGGGVRDRVWVQGGLSEAALSRAHWWWWWWWWCTTTSGSRGMLWGVNGEGGPRDEALEYAASWEDCE